MATAWHTVVLSHKSDILSLWMERLLVLYEGKIASSSPFKDALEAALDTVLTYAHNANDNLDSALFEVSRIFAVQEMQPSKALSLFFELLPIMQKFSSADGHNAALITREYEVMRLRLEGLTLQLFDSFMMHKEKIFQLKLDELKRRLFMQLRRTEV